MGAELSPRDANDLDGVPDVSTGTGRHQRTTLRRHLETNCHGQPYRILREQIAGPLVEKPSVEGARLQRLLARLTALQAWSKNLS